jgi:hypothetical protein
MTWSEGWVFTLLVVIGFILLGVKWRLPLRPLLESAPIHLPDHSNRAPQTTVPCVAPPPSRVARQYPHI